MSGELISREAKLLIQLGEMGGKLWKARDRAWKLGRERNRLKEALLGIAKLDTSQSASPQQCGAVLIAMDALGL